MVDFRISQFSERVGVPATTLRYYETRGLLPTRRTASGYRAYDDHDVERVRFIAAAKDLGIPLVRIRDLLDVWQDGMCRDVRRRLLPLVNEQIANLDARLMAFNELRDDLVEARRRLDALPSRDSPCDPNCAFLSHTPAAPKDAADPPSTSAAEVACSLSPRDHAVRLSRWHTALGGTAPEHLDDGSFRVEIPGPRIAEITALVSEEVGCCPFLRFTLTITRESTRLVATAPADATPLLRDLFLPDATGSDLC